MQGAPVNHFATAITHVIEQGTEIRLIHTQLLLHHFRCQADFPADDAPPLGQLTVRVDLLNGISIVDAQCRLNIAQGRDPFTAVSGLVKRIGRSLQSRIVHGEAPQVGSTTCSSRAATRTRRSAPRLAAGSPRNRKQRLMVACSSSQLAPQRRAARQWVSAASLPSINSIPNRMTWTIFGSRCGVSMA